MKKKKITNKTFTNPNAKGHSVKQGTNERPLSFLTKYLTKNTEIIYTTEEIINIRKITNPKTPSVFL
jgi:hypothetical protein